MKRQRDESATQPVVAFYAHKGGVGKTTSCLTMAVRAHQKGLRVIVLDCDPQQNATAFLSQWQGRERFAFTEDYRAMAAHYRVETKPCADRTEDDRLLLGNYALAHRNLFDLLRMTPRHTSIDELWTALPCIGYEVAPALSVVAAHPMLSAYDNDLAFEVNIRNHQPNYMARLGWLLQYLLKHYDLILLDLSPSNSFFNQMALASSSHFVLPLSGDKFSLQSLDTLDLMLAMVNLNFRARLERPPPQLLCVLYSQYTPGEASVTGFSGRVYLVSAGDYEQHRAIEAVFAAREKDLSRYMTECGQKPRLVMVSEARELHKKLGHTQRTVFDSTEMGLYLMAQQDEYGVLWQCLYTTLFPLRNEWL